MGVPSDLGHLPLPPRKAVSIPTVQAWKVPCNNDIFIDHAGVPSTAIFRGFSPPSGRRSTLEEDDRSRPHPAMKWRTRTPANSCLVHEIQDGPPSSRAANQRAAYAQTGMVYFPAERGCG